MRLFVVLIPRERNVDKKRVKKNNTELKMSLSIFIEFIFG